MHVLDDKREEKIGDAGCIGVGGARSRQSISIQNNLITRISSRKNKEQTLIKNEVR